MTTRTIYPLSYLPKSVLKKRCSEESLLRRTSSTSDKKKRMANEYVMDKMNHEAQSRRESASKLLLSGEIQEAVFQMCQAEAINSELVRVYRRHTLKRASQSGSLSFIDDSSLTSRSERRTVQFHDLVDVIGTADENVDRAPIQVTPPSTIERLLIRSARILPNSDSETMMI